MKFLADGMLGKLARWLRMMGHDVIYSVQLSDNELLQFAKSESRALLTKDFELYKRAIGKCIDAFYVEGKTESARLAEVSKRYGITLEINMDKSYCPMCNTNLHIVEKEALKIQLKPNTYKYFDCFWKCPNCGQVYWQGAHWRQITGTLTQAQEKQERDVYPIE